MPHQNTSSSDATAQNGVGDKQMPNDPGQDQNASAHPEASRYAAENLADSTLAPPAAGEVDDYLDEGDGLGGANVQSGGNNANRPIGTEGDRGQGPKTRAANRDEVRGQD
ncbi:hypothetical protein [Brevundimonas sp. PAMC22021]|uniref:hypothetical protein n=1 Tax=Brevundimonas sp. PAMC22021 TaxID=2861285 RepID=UPI001C639480|nr:hypothetical protein [Brevundimonas sp. PAMC22021]QYF87546.1 hypothetical protein KY493_03295 [Brevundimonas sp. PAMC22021]